MLPGTGGYDQRPEGKNRCPAWCDRILVHSHNPSLVSQEFYRSTAQSVSDHNPVGSLFVLKVRAASASVEDFRNDVLAASNSATRKSQRGRIAVEAINQMTGSDEGGDGGILVAKTPWAMKRGGGRRILSSDA